MKFATGEAVSEIQVEDYNKIIQFVLLNIHAPFAYQLVEKVGDFITENPHLFTIEQRNQALRSLMSAQYKSKSEGPAKNVSPSLIHSLKRTLNLQDNPSIELTYSPSDSSYTLHLLPSSTHL